MGYLFGIHTDFVPQNRTTRPRHRQKEGIIFAAHQANVITLTSDSSGGCSKVAQKRNCFVLVGKMDNITVAKLRW